MIESAPEAIIVYTPEKFLFLNAFAARRLGANPQELVGQPILEFVHPESLPVVVDRIRQLVDGGESGSPLEVRFLSRNGEVMQAEIMSVPIMFEGQPALLGLIRDISRRKAVESALRESEEKFANAFRQSPHGMAFVDLEGRFLKANGALCEMLGYTEDELAGRVFTDLTHAEDVATDIEHLRRMTTGEVRSYHRIKRYRRKDGRIIWVSIGVSAVHDSDGAPIYFIGQIQDITEQKDREEERATAQRRAGILETTIAVAHEMNNVLTVLMMNAELLATDARPEEIPEISKQIHSAASRIAATVQRLRGLSDAGSVDYMGERMLDLSPAESASSSKPKKRKKS
jgi:PAS domain S-box-containing protein